MQRVLSCARKLISRCGDHGVPDGLITATIAEILLGNRAIWACARAGILTQEDTANLVLAHLDTIVERACGRRFYDEATAQADTEAMRRALFSSSAP